MAKYELLAKVAPFQTDLNILKIVSDRQFAFCQTTIYMRSISICSTKEYGTMRWKRVVEYLR